MEKPDFEKAAQEFAYTCQLLDTEDEETAILSFKDGCEHVWNTYVLPLQDKLKESEHLKELADDAIVTLQKEV